MYCKLPENTTCPDVIVADTVVSQLREWNATRRQHGQPFFAGLGIHKVG